MDFLMPLLRPSRGIFFVAVVASVCSGTASMLLVASINDALAAERHELSALGVRFAALCCVALAARCLSEDCFARLGQDILSRLRRRLARLAADAPYERIEEDGSSKLVASLSEDVGAVTQFVTVLPSILIYAAMILGCLVYLGLLHLQLLAFMACFLVFGSLAYLAADGTAIRFLRRARTLEERVFVDFRSLFDGAKELRLHAPRARAFTADFEDSVEAVRREKLTGIRIAAASASAGTFLFFAAIGCVLFVLAPWLAIERSVISAYALIFLYMILPLEALLVVVPRFQQARIAAEHLGALATRLTPPPAPHADAPLEWV